MQSKLIILILILVNSNLLGQSDKRSILELFYDKQKIGTGNYTCKVIIGEESRKLSIDSKGFFILTVDEKLQKNGTGTLIISLDNTQFQLPELNISDLIDRHIEIKINSKAPRNCFYISYYHECVVNPATFNESCPEGHDVSIFDIPIISEELYNEADSLSKTVGVPLELFWFDGIKFTSKEDYIGWIRQNRKGG